MSKKPEPVDGIPDWARKAVIAGFEKSKKKDPVADYDPDKDKESDPETPEARAKYKREIIPKLRSARERLQTPSRLAAGDIVCWKEGLRNGAHPGFHEFGIVTEVLETPVVLTNAEPGSAHFHEKLDIRVMVFPHPDYGVEYLYDSRRMEKVDDGSA